MVSNVDCIPLGYKIEPSKISSMVEYVQNYNANDLSEMGYMILYTLTSNVKRNRRRCDWNRRRRHRRRRNRRRRRRRRRPHKGYARGVARAGLEPRSGP